MLAQREEEVGLLLYVEQLFGVHVASRREIGLVFLRIGAGRHESRLTLVGRIVFPVGIGIGIVAHTLCRHQRAAGHERRGA